MGLWQPSPAGCFLTLHLRWPASCRPCKGQRTRKGGRAVEAPEAPGAVESRGRKRKLGAPRREHVQPFQPHRPRWGWSCAVPALRLHLLPGRERVRACQRSETGRRWVAVLPHCSPPAAGLLGASQSPQPAADHCSGHSGGGTRSLLTLLLLSRPPGLIVSVFCALCLSAVCSSEPRRTPWLWRWAVGCAPGLSPPPHPLRPVRAIG